VIQRLGDAVGDGVETVQAQRRGDDGADPVARVQRRHRVLEDHLEPPPQRAQRRLRTGG
jgi:hypothetical protein